MQGGAVIHVPLLDRSMGKAHSMKRCTITVQGLEPLGDAAVG